MSEIKLGSLTISSFKLGSSDCQIYLGTTKLYPQDSPTPPTPSSGCSYNFCGIDEEGSAVTVNNGTSTLNGYDLQGFVYAVVEGTVGSATTTIGEYCFDGQYSLTSITISDGVTLIEHEAFVENEITTLTIPSSVTQIDFWAFTRLTALTEVIFEGATPPTFDDSMGGVFHEYCPSVIYVPDAALNAYRAINGSVWTDSEDIEWSSDIIQPISNR